MVIEKPTPMGEVIVWHLDGHHKLIRWGVVIHGIADGYDHTVCSHCEPRTQLMEDDNLDHRVTG